MADRKVRAPAPASQQKRDKFKGYVIRRRSDGSAVYVGITVQSLSARWGRHKRDALLGATYAISNAIRKRGAEAFCIEHVWSSFDHDGLKEAEKLMIVQMGTRSPAGYNMTDGGDGTFGLQLIGPANPSYGKSPSEESRAKMRSAMVGRVLSDDHRAKIIAGITGRECAPGTRAKISAAHIGMKHDAATRANMSAAKKGKPGRKQSPEEKAKRSATLKATLSANGRSNDYRAKQSAARAGKPGRKQTEAEKQKRRESALARRDEIGAKSRAAWAIRKASNESPPEGGVKGVQYALSTAPG